jgi:hypothetical protein
MQQLKHQQGCCSELLHHEAPPAVSKDSSKMPIASKSPFQSLALPLVAVTEGVLVGYKGTCMEGILMGHQNLKRAAIIHYC